MAVPPMETREDRTPITPVGRMNMKMKPTPMVTNIMMGRMEGTLKRGKFLAGYDWRQNAPL